MCIELIPNVIIYIGDKYSNSIPDSEYEIVDKEFSLSNTIKEELDKKNLENTPIISKILISNTKFKNKVSIGPFINNLVLKNVIFEDDVVFFGIFRGEILFENVKFCKNVSFENVYIRDNEYTVSNDCTKFKDVIFDSNVDFTGFRIQNGYKFTFGNTIFKYRPIKLETTIGIGRLKEFNDEVIKINNADYDN